MKKFNDVYDTGALIKNIVWFLIVLVAMRYTGGAGFVIIVPLMLLAVIQGKTERMLVFLMVMIAMLIGNGALMPKNTIFSVVQKALMVIMSVVMMSKLAGVRHSRLVTPFMGMFGYVVSMALSSCQGWNPFISYLKLFLFSTCYFAYYGMANTVISNSRLDSRKIRSAYLALACFMLIGSVLLIPFPGISQMSAEAYMDAVKAGANITSLFCGMTFHSQALGPLVATLFVLILGDLLFSVRKPDKLMLILLCCCPILIYKTSSRTAMGTMLVGASFLIWQFMKTRGVSSRWRGKVISVALMSVAVASAALLCTSSGRQSVSRYILKTSEVDDRVGIEMESVMMTRQGLMDLSMENFRKKPILGNGFQVSEALIGAGSGGLASILSAPVEKGVWVSAILEEGGVTGFLLFVGFIISALIKLYLRRAYISAAILLTIIVLNLGEFTMFSMSGIGGVYWCLCFVGVVMDAQRLQQDRMVRVPQRWY